MKSHLTRRHFLASVPLLIPSITETRAPASPQPQVPAIAPAQTGKWWEQEPLRILDLVTAFGQINGQPAAALAQQKAALGYNAEHLHVMQFTGAGIDDQGFFFQTKLAGKQNPD